MCICVELYVCVCACMRYFLAFVYMCVLGFMYLYACICALMHVGVSEGIYIPLCMCTGQGTASCMALTFHLPWDRVLCCWPLLIQLPYKHRGMLESVFTVTAEMLGWQMCVQSRLDAVLGTWLKSSPVAKHCLEPSPYAKCLGCSVPCPKQYGAHAGNKIGSQSCQSRGVELRKT